MTDAKFVTSPAQGHGLTDRITDPHYTAYSKDEPVQMIPALVLLKVHGNGGNDTAQGKHRFVKYEVVKLEPFLDSNERTDAMWRIQALYEARTSTGSQRPLPLGLEGEERRVALMERIEDWAKDREIAGADLEGKWREYWAIGPDKDWSFGDAGVPGDYRRASVQHLLEFALELGAEKPDEDGSPPVVLSDEAGIGADGLPVGDDDPLASNEGGEPDTATAPDAAVKPKRASRAAKNAGLAAVPDAE